MRLRFPLAALFGTGLLVFVLGPLVSAIAQDEPRPEPRLDLPGEQARPGRGGDRQADREGAPVERLRNELNELRRMLEEERNARRQAEERLERSRAEEGRARSDAPVDRERRERVERERVELLELLERERERNRDRERERADRQEAPGIVAVAEAKVEAARAVLEVAELRANAARRKFASAERDGRRPLTEEEELVGRLAIAESQAAIAEARVRLLEAEFNLGQVIRTTNETGEDAVVKVESEFRVEDALKTAEQVIGIIRSFQVEDRPR